jgi:hypothetical protein
MLPRPALFYLALVLALPLSLHACKSGGAVEPAPSSAAEPAAEAAPSKVPAALAHEATPTITAAGQLKDALGKRVHLVGRADNAKVGAVVLLGPAPIYCIGVASWPDAVRNKLVRATGKLVQTDRYKARVDDAGAISQGSAGGDLVLEGCSYKEAN